LVFSAIGHRPPYILKPYPTSSINLDRPPSPPTLELLHMDYHCLFSWLLLLA
jgi:hypothetical protein